MWIYRDVLFFFFSSRRRHTRLQGDWSSDVCSSDLGQHIGLYHAPQVVGAQAAVGADDGTAHQKRHDCRHVEGKDDGCEAAVQLAAAGGCRGNGGRGGGRRDGEGTGEGAFWLYWERGG